MSKVIGGAIPANELKKLNSAGYQTLADTPNKIGDWVLDRGISKETARAYRNDKTGNIHVTHRGTKGLADWTNNLAYTFGLDAYTHRGKQSKRVQERAEAKYKDVETSGHSQGALHGRKYAKDKDKVIEINPANSGHATKSGTVIRSKSDPVSILGVPRRFVSNLFSKKKNTDVTTAAKANPLDAHSLDTLDELGDKVVGKGFKKMRQGYELTPKQIEKSIKLLQNMTR